MDSGQYKGTVQSEYEPPSIEEDGTIILGMYEVRLQSGDVVVSANDLEAI